MARSLCRDPESIECRVFGMSICRPQKRGVVPPWEPGDVPLTLCDTTLLRAPGRLLYTEPPLLRLWVWSPLVARGCHEWS